MDNESLVKSLNAEFGLALNNSSVDDIKQKLYLFINDLIQNDFQKLISILYRIDVDEKKLKQLLNNMPDTDAAVIIGNLIIERQQQKIESRNLFKQDHPASEEDQW